MLFKYQYRKPSIVTGIKNNVTISSSSQDQLHVSVHLIGQGDVCCQGFYADARLYFSKMGSNFVTGVKELGLFFMDSVFGGK